MSLWHPYAPFEWWRTTLSVKITFLLSLWHPYAPFEWWGTTVSVTIIILLLSPMAYFPLYFPKILCIYTIGWPYTTLCILDFMQVDPGQASEMNRDNKNGYNHYWSSYSNYRWHIETDVFGFWINERWLLNKDWE